MVRLLHGVGGLLGTILVGVFASERSGGQVEDLDIARQLGVQAVCALLAAAWSVGVSWLLLKAIGAAIGLRPDEAEERHGLDLSLHIESGYNVGGLRDSATVRERGEPGAEQHDRARLGHDVVAIRVVPARRGREHAARREANAREPAAR